MSLRIVSLREELSRWYKSLGYREVGTSPFVHPALKRPCHFIDMAKPLAPAGACYPGLVPAEGIPGRIRRIALLGVI